MMSKNKRRKLARYADQSAEAEIAVCAESKSTQRVFEKEVLDKYSLKSSADSQYLWKYIAEQGALYGLTRQRQRPSDLSRGKRRVIRTSMQFAQ